MKTMLRISSRFGIIFDRILGVSAAAASALLLAIMLLTGYAVFMRYTLGIGQGWPTEIIDNLLLYITFLGAAWLQKEGGHVAIDLVYIHQSPKTRLILDLVISIIGMIACSVMAWYSGETVVDDLLSGVREFKTVSAPRGVIIGIMPLGFLMLFIEFTRQFIRNLTRLRTSGD